ncbi:hypothetical protein MMC07_005514 [Pseudocyphellaria aurata]|nr:hypothetical protein [Pseudocyphellaria aurata]
MLGWLTGSSRPGGTQGLSGHNDQSYLDDPPETPAPTFAFRAFKSALFGTPQIDPESRPTTPPPITPDRKGGKKENVAPFGPTELRKTGQKADGDVSAKQRAFSLLSPSKGILLTPGTVTNRRKNVSFGGLALNDNAITDPQQTDSSLGPQLNKPSIANPLPIDQRPQTNLTKALHKAKNGPSKKKVDQETCNDTSEDLSLPSAPVDGYRPNSDIQDEAPDPNADVTLDLNQPFSRSGKHWKAEYERYYKRSDREMKEIIMYGKNIKSFAAKKDSEASELGEKLHLELSKVATMEAKVSKLAAQLASARLKDSEDTDQAKLVNDLAKQTALAVRYKQKADRYRSALLKKTSTAAQTESGTENVLAQNAKNLSTSSFQVSDDAQQMALLRGELDRFRETTKIAEEKVKFLEAENMTLRASMDRLKAEAAIYETRRLAREEEFKRRSAILTSSDEDCEARLDPITADHQKPLPKSQFREDSRSKQTMGIESGKGSKPPDVNNAAVAPNTVPIVTSKPAQRIKPQQTRMDIWTPNGQGDGMLEFSPAKERTFDLGSEHMESDLFSGALREIDQNQISEQKSGEPLPSFNRASIPRTASKLHKRHYQSDLLAENSREPGSLAGNKSEKAPLPGSQSVRSSASKRMRERRTTISSPRPSLLNFAYGPAKAIASDSVPPGPNSRVTSLETSLPDAASGPTFPASSVSTAASRTSALAGGRRQPNLPAERLAAAKARLKERSKEKSEPRARMEGGAERSVEGDEKGGNPRARARGE